MRSKEFMVAGVTLSLVAYTLVLSVSGQVLSSLQTSRTVSNAGSVKAIGVGVYWDNGCTNPVSMINWGVLEPDSSKSTVCYVRNEGNSVQNLSMYTSNWIPQNATNYLTLTWDYSEQSLSPDEVIRVTFTLTVSSNVEGISSFTFDITIIGSG